MTTKSFAKPEEPSAEESAWRGEDACGSAGSGSAGERAREQERVAKTAEAIEERLSAMVASMAVQGREGSGGAPIDVEARLRRVKAYLKADASNEARARAVAAHHSAVADAGLAVRPGAAVKPSITVRAGATARPGMTVRPGPAAKPGTGAAGKPAPGMQGRAWFEARFGELKGAMERLATVNAEGSTEDMSALNDRLGDIIGKLDSALSSDTHAEALKSVECQLAGLAGYLERTKAWAEERESKVDARLDAVDARLESLGQAVEQSNKAIQSVSEQTAAQISEAMRRMQPPPGLIRVERDVRNLSAATQEQEQKTAEAVAELHGALRMILDQLASMGEKLSGVGDMLEDARERQGCAEGEVRISSGRTKGRQTPADDGVAREFWAGASAQPGRSGVRDANGHSQPKGHSQSIAYGQLNRRPCDDRSSVGGQQGSKTALAGALIILTLTGAAMFASHFRDLKGGDMAGGGRPQIERTVGAVGTPPGAAGLGEAAASGAAQGKGERGGVTAGSAGAASSEVAKGDAGGAPVRPAPEATAQLPSQGVAKSIEIGAAPGGQKWGAADGLTLPATLASERVRLAAIAGDPAAQYTVASFYETGQGVMRDMAAAARWYRRAAEQNHAPSQYRLATLFERGQGVEKDLASAEDLYQRAGTLGNVKAMHNLGVLLIHKQGDQPDYASAAKWFALAAERGFTDSQYNLAILYEQGLGVSRDLAASYRWFALSAKGGDRQAQTQRDRVAAGLTVSVAAKVDAELAGWRAADVDEAANKVQAPQEQAASAPVVSPQAANERPAAGERGRAGKSVQPNASQPKTAQPKSAASKPAPKRPAGPPPKKALVPGREEASDGGWRSKPQIAAAFVDPRAVLAQANLQKLGYEVGPRDGQLGPKTRRAIRQFQLDHGLSATGELSDVLLQKMATARRKG